MLFAGSTAHAGFIQVNGLITGGQATESQGGTSGMASVFGPGMMLMISSGNQMPFGVGGTAPGSYSVGTFLFAGGTESHQSGTGSGSYNPSGPGSGFGCGAAPGTNCFVDMMTQYTLTVPAFSDAQVGTHQVFTAPFTAVAEFGYCDPDGINCFDGRFLGAGLVNANLAVVAPNLFAYVGAVYDFAAIPEPVPIALVGPGLVAVLLLRKDTFKR
jgi:hypothetical protein